MPNTARASTIADPRVAPQVPLRTRRAPLARVVAGSSSALLLALMARGSLAQSVAPAPPAPSVLSWSVPPAASVSASASASVAVSPSASPSASSTAIAPIAPPTPAPVDESLSSKLPPESPSPCPESDLLFRRHYAEARTRMITGDFEAAAREFAEAERLSVCGCNRALAHEQGVLAREWFSRGLTFVRHSDVRDANVSARAVDRRTDEEMVALYVNAAFYGVGVGVWIDVLAQSNGAAPIILPPLLLAVAAPSAMFALDSGRGFRYGVPQSISAGMYIGLEEGLLFGAWYLTQDNSASPQAFTSLLFGATTLGAVIGGVVGSSVGSTPGRSSYVGSTSVWGGLIVGMVAGAFTTDFNGGTPFAAAGVALNLGLLTGLFTARSVSPSIARVRFLDLGGVAGLLVGGGLYAAAANSSIDGRALSGAAALGTTAGLLIAWFATESMPRDGGVSSDGKGTASARSTFQVTPSITPVPHGAMLGLSGSL